MKNRTTIFGLSLLLLAGCTTASTSMSIEEQIKNPLYAGRYGDEYADMLANIIIMNDPIIQKPGVRALIEKGIADGKRIGQEGHKKETAGLKGAFLEMKSPAQGGVLYVDDHAYFTTDFEIKPGIDLHVYITKVVDPRDAQFPDSTAIDLGPLQSVYGAQSYGVPVQAKPQEMRSVVIWDKTLGYLYSFAQLSK